LITSDVYTYAGESCSPIKLFFVGLFFIASGKYAVTYQPTT